MSLRRRIFSAMLLVTLCVTAVFGELAYGFARNKIEENYKKSHVTDLNSTAKVLDLQVESLIDIARNALSNEQLYSALNVAPADGKLEFGSAQVAVLHRTAYDMANLDGGVDSIVFADLTGHCYLYSNINRGSYAFYQYYREHPLLDEEWVGKARAAAGKEVFYGCGIAGGTDGGELCFVKQMINPRSGKAQGFLIVNFSKQILKKSLINADDDYPTSCYLVVGSLPQKSVAYFESGGFSAGKGSEEEKAVSLAYQNKEAQQTYLFSEVQDTTTGWVIVNAIERNMLSRESKSIRMLFFVTAIVIFAFSLVTSNFIARGITRPLSLLENAIQSVGEGERHLTETFDDSEVGRIGRQFKQMVNSRLELSERLLNTQINEREAQLLLLQAQINPHFLYNTLDSVYCMAMIHGDDEIAEMILALSNNFRLALNDGDKMISVEKAVRHIREYMKLQNMRYHNRFTLTVDVEESILQNKIINFVLQPFVENAICHGLEPKVGPGSLRLGGRGKDGNLIFTVADDGVGIGDPLALERGYGVQNVRERIRLFYGDKYGITVKSAVGKGTVVRIVIPADRNRGGKSDAQFGCD